MSRLIRGLNLSTSCEVSDLSTTNQQNVILSAGSYQQCVAALHICYMSVRFAAGPRRRQCATVTSWVNPRLTCKFATTTGERGTRHVYGLVECSPQSFAPAWSGPFHHRRTERENVQMVSDLYFSRKVGLEHIYSTNYNLVYSTLASRVFDQDKTAGRL